MQHQGDEVLHLPVIVDAAESSPNAAAAAAYQIRKYLSKDNFSRPQVQYNAIMLIRILSDNPGASFTKNIDQKFSNTMKTLLRESRDQSVQQIARETLSALYMEKAYDTNLSSLFAMWTKEQPGQLRPRQMNAPPFNPGFQQPQQQIAMGVGSQGGAQHDNYARGQRSHHGGLPPPPELAARVEEAKTSAKLLQQLVQSTPPSEVQGNDLIKEFGQRVSAAQRSIQGYINSDNPPPDEDTLQTLIETSEQLSLAASKHQRAVLQSRRLVGNQSTPPTQGTPEQYFPGSNRQTVAAPPPQAATTTTEQAPPLPARLGSNGLPLPQPSATQAAPLQQAPPHSPERDDDLYDSYQPPAGPPPNQAPSETEPETPHSLYAAPPMPSTSMQANLARRTSEMDAPPTLAPIQLGSPITPQSDLPFRDAPASVTNSGPPSGVEDPFSDSHASPEPAQASAFVASPPAHTSTNPELTAQARRAAGDDPRAGNGGLTGSPNSYHPGYSSTPSYMHRQASAGDKLVMHGGVESPDQSPVHTPKRSGTRASGEHVSPLTERHR